jgi:hypothetical protein
MRFLQALVLLLLPQALQQAWLPIWPQFLPLYCALLWWLLPPWLVLWLGRGFFS